MLKEWLLKDLQRKKGNIMEQLKVHYGMKRLSDLEALHKPNKKVFEEDLRSQFNRSDLIFYENFSVFSFLLFYILSGTLLLNQMVKSFLFSLMIELDFYDLDLIEEGSFSIFSRKRKETFGRLQNFVDNSKNEINLPSIFFQKIPVLYFVILIVKRNIKFKRIVNEKAKGFSLT